MELNQDPQNKKRHFCQIVIQEKSDNDFRSFCHCIDADGDKWELRGYGTSVEEAAIEAWSCYNDDDWEIHGYVYGKSFR